MSPYAKSHISKGISRVIGITGFVFLANNVSASDCRIVRAAEEHFEMRINSRVITIIGWEHKSHDSQVSQILVDAIQRVQLLPCENARDTLRQVIRRSDVGNEIAQSSRVLSILEEAHRRSALSSVAEEFGIEDSRILAAAAASYEQILQPLEDRCGVIIASIMREISLPLLGPERFFRRSRANAVEIISADDDVLRERSINILNSEPIRRFNELSARIVGRRPRSLFEQLLTNLENERPISSLHLEQIAAFERNVEGRRAFRQDLESVLPAAAALVRVNKERDISIARRLIEAQGNVAMVIGLAHTDNLTRFLTELCLENRRR